MLPLNLTSPLRCVSSVVLLLTLLSPPVGAADASPGAAYYDQAVQLRSEGRLAEAEQALRQAVREDPQNAGYHFELANLYAAIHDQWRMSDRGERARQALQMTAQELEQVLAIDSSYLPARFNLGVTYKRLEQYEDAREELREAAGLAASQGQKETQLRALMQVAETYEEQGFFDEARDTYGQARELDYYNQDIRNALDDLTVRERQYNEKTQRKDAMRSLGTLNQGWSEAARGTRYGMQPLSPQANGATGSGQMISTLGMMLAQQFLSQMTANKEENS